MKVIAIIFAFLALSGCHEKTLTNTEIINARLHADAVDLVNRLEYVRDSRTNICYAYGWEGSPRGVPLLAAVPCELAAKMIAP